MCAMPGKVVAHLLAADPVSGKGGPLFEYWR